MSDRYPEVECYQCGRMKTALSYRSRCLTCETQRADANADENENLRTRLAAVQGEPVAYTVFASNGNIRIWCADPIQVETLRQQYGEELQPLYTAPQAAKEQPK